MGEEIERIRFTAADFETFQGRLRAETDLLLGLDARRGLCEDGFAIGFEVETWLLDHGGYPSPINVAFLEALADPLVVSELSRFNVEFNCDPLPMTGNALSRAEASLTDIWRRCNGVAHGMDANVILIGTLPTLRDADMSLDNLSPMKRYKALNREAIRQHGGPLVVDIEGEQRLQTTHRDVMLEGATTSFQVHLKTPARLAHRYLNASMMVSGPVLAAGVNAPYVFGLDLWRETRIPLFEQAVPLTDHSGQHGRVTFGAGYAKSSMAELLACNADDYPALLPMVFDEPPEAMRHLRMQNGTIWRWNRPVVGFEPGGRPHYRIEHRILPSGPTMVDMIANAAFYLGLVRAFVDSGFVLPFADAHANFYAAARHGLDARFAWAGREIAAPHLVVELLREARRGLAAFGVDQADQDLYLGVVEARVTSGQTGAAWQRAALARRGGDLQEMMSAYCESQRSAVPVHQWAP